MSNAVILFEIRQRSNSNFVTSLVSDIQIGLSKSMCWCWNRRWQGAETMHRWIIQESGRRFLTGSKTEV